MAGPLNQPLPSTSHPGRAARGELSPTGGFAQGQWGPCSPLPPCCLPLLVPIFPRGCSGEEVMEKHVCFMGEVGCGRVSLGLVYSDTPLSSQCNPKIDKDKTRTGHSRAQGEGMLAEKGASQPPPAYLLRHRCLFTPCPSARLGCVARAVSPPAGRPCGVILP